MSNLAVKKTNVVKNNLNIYISAILGVFLAIALSYMFFYKYLRLMSDEQEVAFIEGSNTGIAQLVVNDLSVIFDEKKSLSELLIIKDYTSGDKRQSPNVKGNILYITRNNQPMMFNLKPISTFMYKVLAQDYYYQLKLNRNLLGANIENQEFLFSRVYKLGKNNSFLLNLVPKDNSESLEFIRKKLQKRKIKLFVSFFSAFIQ